MERSEEMRHRIEEMLKEATEQHKLAFDRSDEIVCHMAVGKMLVITELLNSGEVGEHELRQIFKNHSDCYTTFEQKNTNEIGTEQALTEDGFIRVMKMMPNVIASQSAPSNQWISVEERLPESDYDVLIHTEGYTVIGRYVTIFPDKKPKWYHSGYELKSVTHWMPLPSAPSKGETV